MPRGPEFSLDIHVKDQFISPSEEPLQYIEQDFLEKKKKNKNKHVSSPRSVGSHVESSSGDFSSPFLNMLHDIYGNSEFEETVDTAQVFQHEPTLRGHVIFQNNFVPTTPFSGREYYIPQRPEEDDD